MQHYRRISVVAAVIAANAFILWAVYKAGPLRGVDLAVIAMPFFAGPIGAYWMLYDCIRYEKKPWPYLIRAFIPYFFVWHYFERVRGLRSG